LELILNALTNNKPNRRTFILQSVTGLSAVAVAGQASAQAMVDEKDQQAINLGYKADATTVDKAKQAKYVSGQKCGNCALYQGKESDASALCPLFGGKKVSGKGWCAQYVKKG
jgi:High potential iron-sulfur protein